jgi:hypothetical protein
VTLVAGALLVLVGPPLATRRTSPAPSDASLGRQRSEHLWSTAREHLQAVLCWAMMHP